MKHARPDYDRIQDPAGLIPEDEPVFLIRGQDMIAPAILRRYADLLAAVKGDPKLSSLARKQALRMEEWQVSQKVKIPDLFPG